ncbi:MAG: ABC transporter permease [Actinomyces sp.]|uniref:ABC transporter permease n=1 Tax=Actinomyces sp. TaxID=29317 RepID=UPI0026DC2AD4|nr:ABC transporter permease [Actinomyces sp.]MDO4243980.1 ABC transporter permease [Actinomyces sp.]
MMTLASGIIVTVVGVAHGLRSEGAGPAFIVLNLSLTAFLCAVGFFLGMLPFGSRTIQAVTALVSFLLYFGSEAAGPLDTLPAWLRSLLEWNPLKIWFDALVCAYTIRPLPSDVVWKIGLMPALGAAAALVGLRNWRRTE